MAIEATGNSTLATDRGVVQFHDKTSDSSLARPVDYDDDYIIKTERLVKQFKGFVAVDGVDLRIKRGHIHALIGPNGAGKTTCFNLLTKFLEPTSGKIIFNGKDITGAHPARLARQGIVRSFQISATFPNLTVLENVRMALQRNLRTEFHFWKSGSSLNVLNDRAMELLEHVGLDSFASVLAVEMPYGRKRALEIATTLALDPEMMLLDEPTQGMGHEDVDVVIALIKKVSKGRTILMVEHNMKVVSGISDRITVLSRGSVLSEGDYKTISTDPKVMEAYMGHSKNELKGAHS